MVLWVGVDDTHFDTYMDYAWSWSKGQYLFDTWVQHQHEPKNGPPHGGKMEYGCVKEGTMIHQGSGEERMISEEDALV